jgi:ADP-ribosylation factor GTPase-activating protein 1
LKKWDIHGDCIIQRHALQKKYTHRGIVYSWDDATIAERYSGEVGDEWKDRLSAKVEGKDYVPSAKPAPSSMNFGSAAPSASVSRTGTPLGGRSRTDSPSRPGVGGKAKVDDRYFAGLGAANASRPADLPPSQGGKYAGFGSTSNEPVRDDTRLPGFDDLQKDPVAALTKSFGWFTTTVGKTAKTVNDSYIQPTAQKVGPSIPPNAKLRPALTQAQLAETDLAAQARITAAQVARGAQTGAKSAADGFNRFVEGNAGSSGAYRQAPINESKKDFWDNFAEAGNSKPSAIGTSAVKKAGAPASATMAKKDDDNWDKW